MALLSKTPLVIVGLLPVLMSHIALLQQNKCPNRLEHRDLTDILKSNVQSLHELLCGLSVLLNCLVNRLLKQLKSLQLSTLLPGS